MSSKLKTSKNPKQLALEFNEVINKPADTTQTKIIQLNPRKDLYSRILDRR